MLQSTHQYNPCVFNRACLEFEPPNPLPAKHISNILHVQLFICPGGIIFLILTKHLWREGTLLFKTLILISFTDSDLRIAASIRSHLLTLSFSNLAELLQDWNF
ncbi:UNVERIFIED_CONTAM: hypothetical protein K2H54_068601 [Gekko kuhli]